jgi:hypothetical protein
LRRLFIGWKDHLRRERAAEALARDESAEVRSVAAYALAATSTDITKKKDVKILLETLQDEFEDAAVRGAAYDALLILHRKPDFPTKRRCFNPEADVDWNWVQSLTIR